YTARSSCGIVSGKRCQRSRSAAVRKLVDMKPSSQQTIPTEHPPRHGQCGLGFRAERLGMGWAGAGGAMCQLADQLHRPGEREPAMMAMVTDGQRASTRPAPWLLDGEYKACEYRLFRPAVCHDDSLPIQDVLGNHHTIDRHPCVLAFCRTIVKKN